MSEQLVSVYVGIDWAQDRHQVCAEDAHGKVLDQRSVEHTASGLAAMCDWLIQLARGEPTAITVGIETPHGIVVETLLDRGLAVFAINPKQLDRFRDRFSMSGAKDDRRDALVLADSLRTDRQAFRKIAPDAPRVVEIREWSRMHDELQQEHVKLSNRFREQLLRYFPQFLSVSRDVGTPWVMELWKLVPDPRAAEVVKPKIVRRLLTEHRIRKIDGETAVTLLRQTPMKVAAGTTEAAKAHIELLRQRLAVLNDQLKLCDRRLEELIDQLPAEETSEGKTGEQHIVTIARSLPGVGSIVLAVLLAEAAKPLRAGDYRALRSLSGVAPVTKRSGKSISVVRRLACNARLANAVYHWARVACQRDEVSKARYRALRSRGCSHGRALRSVADALLRVLAAMVRQGTVYDPQRRVAA
jgi:transposase